MNRGQHSDSERTRSLSGTTDEAAAATLSMPDMVGRSVGRYRILRVVGMGGMGVVFAAHDPTLRRQVAVKLVRILGSGSVRGYREARLLAEAQTIAALSHPNIVTIHDVGVEDGRLFLAMEYVEGLDLQQWISRRRRSWQDVLAVYRRAAAGLTAAHARGVLHLDFKPENVLLELDDSGDGADAVRRVLVTDFGLARWSKALGKTRQDSAGSERSGPGEGRRTGTPAFMAPEHALGMEVDERADQFSFCVSLYGALSGHHPFRGSNQRELLDAKLCERFVPSASRDVPRWLFKVLRRGLAANPESRYPSLEALLADLEPARRLRRTRTVAGGAAVVGGFVAFAAASPGAAEAPSACNDAVALAGTWDARARDDLHRALSSVPVPHASDTAERVQSRLDTYTKDWRRAYVDACLSGASDGAPPLADRDAVMACLNRQRAELKAVVDRLRDADRRSSEHAVEAAAGLTAVDTCRRPPTKDAPPQPIDAELIDAEALLAVGYFDRAAAAAATIVGATQLDGPPRRLARALLVQGRAEQPLGRFAEAAAHLEQAYFVALREDLPTLAVDAATSLVVLRGREQASPEAAAQWARHAEALLERVEEPDRRRAALLNNTGIVEIERGRFDEAIELHRRALELRVARDPDDPVVGDSLNNLAVALQERGDLIEAQDFFQQALELRESALGGQHPDVGASYNNLGSISMASGRLNEAMEAFDRAVEIWRRSFGEEHHDIGLVLENLASAKHQLGRFDEARQDMLRALSIFERVYGPEHPDVGMASRGVGMIEFDAGDLELSREYAERSREIFVAAYGPAHPLVAQAQMDLGAVARRRGEDELARRTFEQALQTWRDAGFPEHPDSARALQGLGDLALTQGDVEAAVKYYAAELRVLETGFGSEHPDLAYPLTTMAQALFEAGDLDSAAEAIERAVAVRSRQGDHDSLLAFARFVQAQIAWEHGGDRSQARAQAKKARRALEDIGGANADLTENIDEWLAEHSR